MTWRTHMAVGANAVWFAGLFGTVDQSLLTLLPVAMFASILPDIDATAAKIHYIGGGVLGIFRNSFHGKYFHHRGLMHSLPVALLFFIILQIFFHEKSPMLAHVFFLAYMSHPIIDGFNSSVGYLYPFVYKRFALVPRFLRTPVGGVADAMLLFGALLGLIVFFAAFRQDLLPTQQLNF